MNSHGLAYEISVLTDEERRKVNALLLAVGGRCITDPDHLDGYRKLAQRCTELEQQRDDARREERERVLKAIEATMAPFEQMASVCMLRETIRRIREES